MLVVGAVRGMSLGALAVLVVMLVVMIVLVGRMRVVIVALMGVMMLIVAAGILAVAVLMIFVMGAMIVIMRQRLDRAVVRHGLRIRKCPLLMRRRRHVVGGVNLAMRE